MWLFFLVDLNRKRHEAQHKNYQREEGYGLPFCIERAHVPRSWMSDLHHNGEYYRDKKSAWAVIEVKADDRQRRHHDKRDSTGPVVNLLAKHGIDRVAAVELA